MSKTPPWKQTDKIQKQTQSDTSEVSALLDTSMKDPWNHFWQRQEWRALSKYPEGGRQERRTFWGMGRTMKSAQSTKLLTLSNHFLILPPSLAWPLWRTLMGLWVVTRGVAGKD